MQGRPEKATNTPLCRGIFDIGFSLIKRQNVSKRPTLCPTLSVIANLVFLLS